MRIVKSDSAFCSRDALTAVVWSRPLRNRKGAIVEPESMIRASMPMSFLLILASVLVGVSRSDRILFFSGENRTRARDMPANR